MRCPQCGQRLEDGTKRCTRCKADLLPASRRRFVLVSLIYVLVAVALVALLTYIVLKWHDRQLWNGIISNAQAASTYIAAMVARTTS